MPFEYKSQLKIIFKNPEFLNVWEKIEKKLSNIFRLTADMCQMKEQITADQRNRYFVSGGF